MIILFLLLSYFFNIIVVVVGVVNVGVICEWIYGFFCGFYMVFFVCVRLF